MCKECRKTFCSNSCPSFTGYIPGRGKSHRVCSACGTEIDGDDFYYVILGDTLCDQCVTEQSMTELADLFGFENISYLILELGGEYRRD